MGCLIFAGCFIGMFFIHLFTPRERIYHISEKDLYMRVKAIPISDYGYIYLGKDSTGVYQSKNYLKIHKVIDYFIVSMYLKREKDNDTIYYISPYKPHEMKQTDFIFVEKNHLDSDLYDSKNNVKQEYMFISILDFNKTDILVSKDSSIHLKWLAPIN